MSTVPLALGEGRRAIAPREVPDECLAVLYIEVLGMSRRGGARATRPGGSVGYIGTWRFTFQARDRDGSFTSTWDAGTWTYSAYNPERKIWEMQGINTNIGAFQPGLMWSDGDDRLLTEWYGPMLVRFRYFAIEPDKFLWRADATFDRGKTWIRDYWTMEVHRISR